MRPAALASEQGVAVPALHPEIARVESLSQRYELQYLGRNVCWRRWGIGGPPLVLLHGGHGNWMHWVRNIETLSRQHTVWIPDMPGFGDSDNLAGDAHDPARHQQLLDALVATLDTLVGRAALVDLAGFSFGGLIAAEIVTQRPHVGRLALLGPAGHGGTRRQAGALVNWRSNDPIQMREDLSSNLDALMLHEPAPLDSLAFSVHQTACMRTRFRSKAISRAAGLRAAIALCEIPVLLIWGEHDVTAVPHEIAPQLADLALHREWCVVPGAGHWVQYESADSVNGLLCRWFAADAGAMQ